MPLWGKMMRSTMCSRNGPMAKPFTCTLWPLSIFCNINLRKHVVFGCCLLIAMTKFHPKCTSLQQVNSRNSQVKFEICCTNIHKISRKFCGILQNISSGLWTFGSNITVFEISIWRVNLHVGNQKQILEFSSVSRRRASKGERV